MDNWVREVSRARYERIGGATPQQQRVAGVVHVLGDNPGAGCQDPHCSGRCDVATDICTVTASPTGLSRNEN